ncbi:RICIN domain-containing protein [Micromonospora echinofusca]|uniref:XRE family transcriptional regulator n=1 Tax=Micromonospora echinofusca TaxID=47858 RepID=A0ABS3VKW9_MICEH|nr:RICIN domain-containing protein [Micromonospora echinofusca]MBO4205178.1 XRE family transcriptional regulator [Micromonospora echinofusca]
MGEENVPLDSCRDATEFVQLMRQIKDQSGYTFRQLEKNAAAVGDVLARSTIADVLRRQSLPRPEVLAAFVRACVGPEHVESWVAARDRLAGAAPVAAGQSPAEPEPTESMPAPARPWQERARRAGVPLAALAVLVPIVVAAWIVLPDERRTSTTGRESAGGIPTPTSRGLALHAVESVARIRPARTPQLCLSEGREHTRQFRDVVAVQRPCKGSVPPETVIERVRDGLYYIKWVHPQHGIGCLTVINGGPAADMLTPWSDCRDDRLNQLFRIEAVDVPVPGGFRLRPASTEALCVGIRDNELTPQAEAVQEVCTGDGDQEFLIEFSS